MGKYAQLLKTLPVVPKNWAESKKVGEVLRWKAPRRNFADAQLENREFYNSLADRHLDSVSFLTSVRNSVGKQSFYKSRPKNISRSLSGEVLGRVSVSHDTRKNLAYADANRALLSVDELLIVGDLRLSWGDQSICDWARVKAAACEKLAVSENAFDEISALIESYGFELPPYDLFGELSVIARACDERWWRRRARVAKVRAMDQLARSFRMVHAKAQIYCSNEAVKIRRSQSRRNRMTLEGFEAVNQDGDSYTLAELSDLSISNPTNRRHELMVRMRGFETLADQFGHVGLFTTMSCPSKFHPMRQIKNEYGRLVRIAENQKYNGSTPRDAQGWLNKTWALIRAQFDREGIRCYGFRVVEPHHDGCPHWHQLLFFLPSQVERVKEIFKHYILREDGDERGAHNRLKIVFIDKAKGSAAGYIAKYISKSIDGTGVSDDRFGNSGETAAERICAWAASWGIRQFQQIGGASVTVWRELRRLDDAEGVAELAREAADASDWAAYILVQGGGNAFFGRNDQKIRPAYWQEVDSLTGEVIDDIYNQYGELSKGKIFGVVSVESCKYFVSRFYRWTVGRINECVKAPVSALTAAGRDWVDKGLGLMKKALPVGMSEEDYLDLMRGDGFGSIA